MTTKTLNRVDTKTITGAINLIDLAGNYTELRRESSREWSGPCPKCGGNDRFHATPDWFACRQCHDRRGDAIEFMRWLRGVSFRQAVDYLAGGKLTDAPTAKRTPTPAHTERAQLPTWAATKLAAAQARLTGEGGAPGRDYLIGRGLLPATWQAFGLGFDPAVAIPGTKAERTASAIAIPWHSITGKLVGVRYRFLQPHEGRKTTAMQGSTFAGNLYGAHLLTPDPRMTLLICEGELNAASIWQVAAHTRVDVLSVGSEAAKISGELAEVIAKYGRVISWLDRPEHAIRVADQFPGALPRQSPDGIDANDRLQAGKLGGLLAAMRLRLCTSDTDRLALLWDWYDGGLVPAGLDEGTAGFVDSLARELGQGVTLRNVNGVWFTGTV